MLKNALNYDIRSLEDDVDPKTYGQKAAWLVWLDEMGYRVPDSIFLPAASADESSWLIDSEEAKTGFEFKTERFKHGPNTYDVAIRSSATCEDTEEESLAGRFKTIKGEMNLSEIYANVERVIKGLERADLEKPCSMGVIVQERINAERSGVVFSSNPVTGAKDEVIISTTEGEGEPLVTGQTDGEDIVVKDGGGDIDVDSEAFDLSRDVIRTLYSAAKKAEKRIGKPADIEWCIEKESKDLYYLQCRPAAGAANWERAIIPITKESHGCLPQPVRIDSRIQKRVHAESEGIQTANAYAVIVELVGDEIRIPDLSEIAPATGSEAYSTALLYPNAVLENFNTSFLPHRLSVQEFLQRCQRYCMRSYPELDSLEETIEMMASSIQAEYWNAVVIVQEVRDHSYTGIIKKINNRYIIEIGSGHFVPKGVVAASRYVLDDSGELLYEKEPSQDKQFLIADGYVLKEQLPEARDSSPGVPKRYLHTLISKLKPLIDEVGIAVEFGINKEGSTIEPYLIDFVEEGEPKNIESVATTSGLISTGSVTGKFRNIKNADVNSILHDLGDGKQQGESDQTAVFYYERPDISLLKLVEEYDSENIGFVFDKGSVLCHLAVTLRERDIPAIIADGGVDVQEGETVQVNADESIPKPARLIPNP